MAAFWKRKHDLEACHRAAVDDTYFFISKKWSGTLEGLNYKIGSNVELHTDFSVTNGIFIKLL